MPGDGSERKDEGGSRITMVDARERFTEVVDLAMAGESQVITRYDRDVVVLLGMKEYQRLRALDEAAA